MNYETEASVYRAALRSIREILAKREGTVTVEEMRQQKAKRSNEDYIAEQFPEDVKHHAMTVLLDSGVHRHLHFAHGTKWVHAFSLTTWPGHLAISGDMGTFVFSRLPDMFEFFRGRGINPHYWEEKLEAVDRRTGPAKQFDADEFHASLREFVTDFVSEAEDDEEKELRQKALASFNADTSHVDGEPEHKIREFWEKWEDDYTGFQFPELWEVRGTVYTMRFLWACHAIVWGIAQYDAHKSATKQEGLSR